MVGFIFFLSPLSILSVFPAPYPSQGWIQHSQALDTLPAEPVLCLAEKNQKNLRQNHPLVAAFAPHSLEEALQVWWHSSHTSTGQTRAGFGN